MSSSLVFLLAFGIGVVTGLRSMTGPAVVCWAAHLGWLKLEDSRLALMGSTVATYAFSAFAIGELIADKLPFIPNRTSPGPLFGRIVLGALCGATLCAAGGYSRLWARSWEAWVESWERSAVIRLASGWWRSWVVRIG